MASVFNRKFIFISYAREDSVFAQWLAKALTKQGYYVWIDCFAMLGGEPFPQDITLAIKNQTFRFLALMSKSSVNKDTPVKERTLADKARKEMGIKDFIIPLFVDDLSPNDLDLWTTDLSGISFRFNWFDGLSQLIKKLESVNTPKDQKSSLPRLRKLLDEEKSVVGGPETLTTNLLEIEDVPTNLKVFKAGRKVSAQINDSDWVFYRNGENYFSFLNPPEEVFSVLQKVDEFDWNEKTQFLGLKTEFVVRSLIRKHIDQYLISRGLRKDWDSGRVYFPKGFFENDSLKYENIKGKKTYVSVHGQCVGGRSKGGRRYYKYHLAPKFEVCFSGFGKTPVISVKIEFYFSEESGHRAGDKQAFRYRKKYLTMKFNDFWLNRVMAVTYWFAQGMDRIRMIETDSGSLTVSCKLKQIQIDKGINESALDADNVIQIQRDDIMFEVDDNVAEL